ncbi:MAG TPA: autotransporter outer membrane beta-barrel domain-containing protein, partial [Candidatus Desulfovibrio intestinipullorum]|nr:autotransporter outer membrane beta-barrel domain-containing protein [Candidatus Desulfovibrio intestinipullorum]
LGFHVALAARRTHVQDSEEAQADTKSAFVGLQALLAPDSWNGFYLTGQGRIGIESGEMDRDIRINGYNRQAESRWSALAGSLQAGFGWDAHLNTEAGFVTMGPLAFFEYAFLHRPSLEESKAGAARLDVEDTVYDSLLMNLGAHAGWQTTLANGTTLGLDVLAAWRHELLDATFATSAAFRGYEDQGFASDSELPGRDSLLVQAGLTLTSSRDFTAQLEVGGEFFRENYTGVNIGLNLAWEF